MIPLTAGIAAQEHGDARKAIEILRQAGEIADKNGAEMVTEQTVREAQSQVEKETVIEAMREMTTQAHLALSAIAVLEKAGDTPVRTKPVFGVYQNIADLVDADKLVQRRMRDHLLD